MRKTGRGTENRFSWQLPKRASYSDLTLKYLLTETFSEIFIPVDRTDRIIIYIYFPLKFLKWMPAKEKTLIYGVRFLVLPRGIRVDFKVILS